ncbi:MAG: DNA polymerase III subunit delta [Cytophagales bacterium]|nr:DNA polymerase III subunit delta [Cytophagales bacterium]
MRFSGIPGLAETKERLIRSVRGGKIAHAQLFIGREGTLNLPMALAFTTYLHCANRTDKDSCGECPACTKNLRYIHPDTHFVFPVSNVKGDKDHDRFRADIMKSWRSFLVAQPFGNFNDWTTSYGGEDKQAIISKEESREIIKSLSLKPFESPVKVMIIWQPESMHPSAANGILKILEEPPVNTFFILVSNNPERLLPTMLSRTQQVTLPMLADEDLDQFLQSQEGLPEARRKQIVTEAGGSVRLALALLDAEEEEDHHQQMADWMRACYKQDVAQLISLADAFHQMDRLQQQALLISTLGLLRETLLASSDASGLLRSRNGEDKFVHDFSKAIPAAAIERGYALLTEASFHLERNGSAKMIFLDTSLQLAKAMN